MSPFCGSKGDEGAAGGACRRWGGASGGNNGDWVVEGSIPAGKWPESMGKVAGMVKYEQERCLGGESRWGCWRWPESTDEGSSVRAELEEEGKGKEEETAWSRANWVEARLRRGRLSAWRPGVAMAGRRQPRGGRSLTGRRERRGGRD